MATVYILYSPKLDKYYVGSCEDFPHRFQQHLNKSFPKSFSAKSDQWEAYFLMEELGYMQARKIEMHIKKMKSKKYIENLKTFPEMAEKLRSLYC